MDKTWKVYAWLCILRLLTMGASAQCTTDAECDDGVGCTVDACDEGTGTCANTPDDAACDDGVYCNGAETCDAVLNCQAGAAPCDDGNPCTNDFCYEHFDWCTHVDNSLPCDDGDPCTIDDTCEAGACGGTVNPACTPTLELVADPSGLPVDSCYGVGDLITVGLEMGPSLPLIAGGQFFLEYDASSLAFVSMDPGGPPFTDEVYEFVDQANGTIDYLVSVPTIELGTSGPATMAVITFQAISECEAFVRFRPHNPPTRLADVDAIERDPILSDLSPVRINGTAPVPACPEDISVHAQGCDTAAIVTWPPVTAMDSCDGSVAVTCTSSPTPGLESGNAFPLGVTTMTCEAANSCGVVGACSFDVEVLTVNCDDGVYCNGPETCDPVLGCQAGTPPDCDDGVGCTQDTCDEELNSCANNPQNDVCDDGIYCNGPEICDPALDCQAGSDPCTAPAYPVCDEPNDTCVECLADGDCGDGVYCNGFEICVSSACQPGMDPCDDGVGCTADSCDEGTYTCTHAPDDAVCDDDLACTQDVCDAVYDCRFTPNNALCDDGQFCTGAETCDQLMGCLGGADPCPDQLCDEGRDLCVECFSDSDCNDNDVCTVDECSLDACWHRPNPYGDVNHSGTVNIFDLFCVLNGFASDFSECSFEDDDLEPCQGNGVVNIFDLFAVVSAFGGVDPCCGAGGAGGPFLPNTMELISRVEGYQGRASAHRWGD